MENRIFPYFFPYHLPYFPMNLPVEGESYSDNAELEQLYVDLQMKVEKMNEEINVLET